MTRFLHTSDWQLGMTRHFLGEDAQPRFTQARFDAIRRIGDLAVEHGAEFVVVAGDVFETNQVSRATVARTLEALKAVAVPVFLLPGNHDPLDAASVFQRPHFKQNQPDHVVVLNDEAPRPATEGVEVVGAPWRSKRPLSDLVADLVEGLEPAPGTLRIAVGHGACGEVAPALGQVGLIDTALVEAALADGRIHYLALGDRHSTTAIGATGRIAYSGAPVATDYVEDAPNNVLLVECTAERCTTTPLHVGRWRFDVVEEDLIGEEPTADLQARLDAFDDKARTVIKLKLTGTVTVRQAAALERLLDDQRDVFAALEAPERHRHVAVVPDDADFADLQLGGFAAQALAALEQRVESEPAARDALALLWRLGGGQS